MKPAVTDNPMVQIFFIYKRPPALNDFYQAISVFGRKIDALPADKAGLRRRLRKSMRLRTIFWLPCGMALFLNGVAAEEKDGPQIKMAARFLREAGVICQQDNGALWGKTLCGPLMLVNSSTREI